MNKNKIYQGDCIEVMRTFPDNSIDTIITDPPYGLEFMGKKWDYDVPAVELWKEALRVLKPGGTALVFAGSRTQHRMAVNVEDAGFILKDCIMWLYGSGFPKATDISKQLDKGHEREVVGKKDYTTPKADNSIGANSYGISGGSLKSGQKAERLQEDITAPATPEAKQWNGWKSHGLKPAYEPILVAMKPNDGTYANNALKHGVSGLNIDGGRIGTTDKVDARAGHSGFPVKDADKSRPLVTQEQGRFPANIILDEEAGKMLDEQSGELKGATSRTKRKTFTAFKRTGELEKDNNVITDKGGASRFFYVAKASKAERNAGCEGLELVRRADRNKDDGVGGDNQRNRTNTLKQNHHPTVKPLALMEYLCTLTKTPSGGIVLDPFLGSGTTALAAQNTGRSYIGIEKEKEYIRIAEARLAQKT